MKNRLTLKQRIFGQEYINDERIENNTNKVGSISFNITICAHIFLLITGMATQNNSLAGINAFIIVIMLIVFFILTLKYNSAQNYKIKLWHSAMMGLFSSIGLISLVWYLDGITNYWLVFGIAIFIFLFITFSLHAILKIMKNSSDKGIQKIIDEE